MKEYRPDAPRLVTWHDMQGIAGRKPAAIRSILSYYARVGKDKRRLVLNIWRKSIQSVQDSTEPDSADRRAANRLARENREEWNDRALLAAIMIVQNEEYTTAQEHRARDLKRVAEDKKAAYYAGSKKQRIIRQYDLIEKLHRIYGSWGATLQAIKRRPPKGDPDPFRELRGVQITAKYLSNVMGAEKNFRA